MYGDWLGLLDGSKGPHNLFLSFAALMNNRLGPFIISRSWRQNVKTYFMSLKLYRKAQSST
jgi:hypothetical protein